MARVLQVPIDSHIVHLQSSESKLVLWALERVKKTLAPKKYRSTIKNIEFLLEDLRKLK